MPNVIEIKPELLRWAIDRARLTVDAFGERRDNVALWLAGEKKPTLRQLERFAAKVHVPIGYLFLDEPPEEKIPIPDYRTFDDKHPGRISPDLIDTLHEVQHRQDWMREFLIETGADKLPFLGSITKNDSVEVAAEKIRADLALAPDWAIHCRDNMAARKCLRNTVDDYGILISISGMVGLSTRRSLDPEEFCGFALLDEYAPALFVNGKISLSAQMFTIAHELAHIWTGSAGIFNQGDFSISSREDEKFCNGIAAEFLVPKNLFIAKWNKKRGEHPAFQSLANLFKVSPIVVARRALDMNLISRDEFFSFWTQEKKNWDENKGEKKTKNDGGNSYKNYRTKLGKRFSEAVISATRSGFLAYRDAFRLTGLKGGTFDKYITRLQGGELE